MKYKLLLFIKRITVSKELHASAHESHHQAYKYGTSKTKKVQLSAGPRFIIFPNLNTPPTHYYIISFSTHTGIASSDRPSHHPGQTPS